ncbi:hypothetical protein NW825_26590, partial [Brevibacillus laterosporus]|nr:hypothetical protein [Brevibacillus laterosporus]
MFSCKEITPACFPCYIFFHNQAIFISNNIYLSEEIKNFLTKLYWKAIVLCQLGAIVEERLVLVDYL